MKDDLNLSSFTESMNDKKSCDKDDKKNNEESTKKSPSLTLNKFFKPIGS